MVEEREADSHAAHDDQPDAVKEGQKRITELYHCTGNIAEKLRRAVKNRPYSLIAAATIPRNAEGDANPPPIPYDFLIPNRCPTSCAFS